MIDSATTIAHYKVEELIGTGGMGEVYRALDTRLGRPVALKILPADSGQSRLRIRRFQQEAKAASSLNHPNILTVYDAGESNQLHFIASELIAGSTLRDLMHRDRVPLKRLVEYLAQAADGIAKAHAAGIVHRDLKPDNIMVTNDGFAKVLDFGLAKLAEKSDELVTIPDSTREGLVFGTVAYMSPEQAQGKPVDFRSDIFSFGSILYEAAARHRPFRAESDAETLHQIIHDDPPPLTGIPIELERVIVRALAKDPDERIQSMKDVALELRDIARSYDGLRVRTSARRRFAMRTPVWLAVAAVTFAVGILIGHRTQPAVQANEPIRFTITPPPKTSFMATPNSSTALQFAVAPDGKSIAFVVISPGTKQSQLWLRELSSSEARPIAGTEGAWFPFWSPRGDAVGFFADSKLKRITLGTSTPVILAEAPDPRGGAWGRDDVILFAPTTAGPIYRVGINGGDPVPVTVLNASRKERGHRWPYFLPDGKRFVYLSLASRRSIFAGSLESRDAHVVIDGTDSNAEYVSSGELLFLRRGSLYAQRVDESTLTPRGEPALIEQHIGYASTLFFGSFSTSSRDLIAFAQRVSPDRQLTWFDRGGHPSATVADPADWGTASLSVVHDKALVTLADPETAKLNIWQVDLTRATASPLTTDVADENHPVLSPDGTAFAFTSNRAGLPDLYVASMADPRSARLLVKGNAPRPWSWTPDGRSIIYWERSAANDLDLWIVDANGSTAPRPLIRSRFNDGDGTVSPDGKWLAYTSDDSGRDQVYVQPFGSEGSRSVISTKGGKSPQWSRDGRDLYYVTAAGEIAEVRVKPNGSQLTAGLPEVLFKMPGLMSVGPTFRTAYAVGDDGRFLFNVTPAEGTPATITAVVHWHP